MTTGKRLLQAGVAFACLSAMPPALAQSETYDLVLTMKSETGEQFKLLGGIFHEYFECRRELKRTKIGRVVPRGTLIDANGGSHAATILSAKCVRRN